MLNERLTTLSRHRDGAGLWVELVLDRADLEKAQRLRHRVFIAERGVSRRGAALDADRFDAFCDHLIVRTQGGRVVGTYRMLPPGRAVAAGGFYSEGEFDLAGLRPLLADTVEIGRACVDPEFRGGAVIALLWSGLIRYIAAGGYRYVMGCASIDVAPGMAAAAALCRRLVDEHLAPDAWREQRRGATIGTPEEVIAHLRAFGRVGVGYAILLFPYGREREMVRLVGEWVIPALR